VDAGTLTAGTVCNINRVKGLEFLIEAAAKVGATRTDFQLAIIGGPVATQQDYYDELVALRDRLAATNVHFLGNREDVPNLLPGFDLYVMASRMEASPLSVLEAMAASLPVVATRVGGVPEIVAEGETGLLVPAEDAGALADAIEGLLADDTRREAMGRAGRQRVEDNFSLEAVVARTTAVVEQVHQRPRERR
jgi:glycosyltransferase involved in cell wall biosynthesis